MQERYSRIMEEWFLMEPLLFQVMCTHELAINGQIACPLRAGRKKIEYNPDIVKEMTDAIARFRADIRHCKQCNNLSDDDVCPICADSSRDHSTICVVEDPRDVIAIERTHEYNGLYHVLHGAISPMNGITPEKLKIKELLARCEDPQVAEIIVATNPNVEGEATAMYLSRLLKPLGIKVTRLAYGVPVGADLEYADEITLFRALEGRRDV